MAAEFTIPVTQDTKDVFQSIRRCGETSCAFYVEANVVEKDVFDTLVELSQLDFVDTLEEAITARDKPMIGSILKKHPQAELVRRLLLNFVPKE